jgi:hypothetical protein
MHQNLFGAAVCFFSFFEQLQKRQSAGIDAAIAEQNTDIPAKTHLLLFKL